MSTEGNKALARRFIAAVLGGSDFAALQALTAHDCVDHAAPRGQPPGPAAIVRVMIEWRAAFPDLQIVVEDLVPEGDRVAARWVARGTHAGAFAGLPPSGQRVAVTGAEFYRLADGKIAERWAVLDTLGLLHQLDAPDAPPRERVPVPGPA